MTSERTEFARQLRKDGRRGHSFGAPCAARFHRAKFRRQVPFDRYVVDFYCHAAKLVIDPRTAIRGDGKQHEWFSGYDAGRTEVLERLGVRVVRFTNAEVCDDLDSAPGRIYAEMRLP